MTEDKPIILHNYANKGEYLDPFNRILNPILQGNV